MSFDIIWQDAGKIIWSDAGKRILRGGFRAGLKEIMLVPAHSELRQKTKKTKQHKFLKNRCVRAMIELVFYQLVRTQLDHVSLKNGILKAPE